MRNFMLCSIADTVLFDSFLHRLEIDRQPKCLCFQGVRVNGGQKCSSEAKLRHQCKNDLTGFVRIAPESGLGYTFAVRSK